MPAQSSLRRDVMATAIADKRRQLPEFRLPTRRRSPSMRRSPGAYRLLCDVCRHLRQGGQHASLAVPD